MDPNRVPLRKIPVVPVPQISQDIGSTLKSRREARGQSLDAVSQQTRIPKRFLEAMEKNQLDEFPALVYLRGFLKSYCEHLELDFESLWSLVQPPAPPATASAQGDSHHAAPQQEEPARNAQSPAKAALLFAAALALGLILFLRRGAVEEAAPAAEPPAALAPLSSQTQSTLSIVFRQEAWISLKTDGNILFEGRAPQGARQEWKSKKGFSLRAPQPQNLEITFNSLPYRLPSAEPGGEHKIE